jgi:hypothetical protein
MEVNSQLHASADLSSGEKPVVSSRRAAEWTLEPSLDAVEDRKISCSLQVIEPPFPRASSMKLSRYTDWAIPISGLHVAKKRKVLLLEARSFSMQPVRLS